MTSHTSRINNKSRVYRRGRTTCFLLERFVTVRINYNFLSRRYRSVYFLFILYFRNNFIFMRYLRRLWAYNVKYEGESNENRKTEIKIRNIAPLSYKLADMLPML
jgi:hypothetical protein